MNKQLIVIPLVVLGIASCDRAKNLADKASSAVKNEIAAQTGGASDRVDPELEKLVDRSEEGVVFRKDLPFPNRIEVRTTRKENISGRFLQSSEMGKQASTVNGTEIHVAKLERAGDQVRYTAEVSSFVKPSEEDPEAKNKVTDEVIGKLGSASKPWIFKKKGNVWQADEQNGFRGVTVMRQIAPVFDVLLEHGGLSPRSLWFAKRRLKVGDEVTVSEKSLPMLVSGEVKGSCKLKLESFEAVDGHPCGVFSITGDYRRSRFPDFEGNFTDEDVSIESGKVWLSLIYPIVLREELDTIQTIRSGKRGGFMVRGQGSVKMSVTRSWKEVKP